MVKVISALITVACVFSVPAQSLEISGRVYFKWDESGKYRASLVTSKEFAAANYIHEIYLDGFTPTRTGENEFLDSLEVNGTTIYPNDFIKVSGTEVYEDKPWYYLRNAQLVEVLDANPRIECHSQVESNFMYYVSFGYPSADSQKDPGTFIRVDTCQIDDGVDACSYTWGTGRFLTRNAQLDLAQNLFVKTEYDSYAHFDSGAQSDFIEKYGKDAYWTATRNHQKNFEIELTSNDSLGNLPLERGAGVYLIKNIATANSAVTLNSKLDWKVTLGNLTVNGSIPLYCYRWH